MAASRRVGGFWFNKNCGGGQGDGRPGARGRPREARLPGPGARHVRPRPQGRRVRPGTRGRLAGTAGGARARLRRRMGAGPTGDLGGPVGGAGRGVAVRLRRARVPVPALRARALAAQLPGRVLVGGRLGWARVAHPSARLAPRRAGEPPGRVGDEAAQRRSLDARLAWVADMADGTAGVSAGPAGPPDPSRMPPAAMPDHDARGPARGAASPTCRGSRRRCRRACGWPPAAPSTPPRQGAPSPSWGLPGCPPRGPCPAPGAGRPATCARRAGPGSSS